MSLPWFRLYHELKDDPKIGSLDDASFRVFIEALCWACEHSNGGGTGLTLENANWAFRRTVTTPLQSLFQSGLLTENEQGEIFVPKWGERQKPSDDSSQRVHKHRAKTTVTANQPLQSRSCNATEESRVEESRVEEKRVLTPPEVESEPVGKSRNPTVEEVRLAVAKIGLPESDADWFWNKCEGNGWTNGGKKIKSWPHVIAAWKAQGYMPSQKHPTTGISMSGKPFPRNAQGNIVAW